MSWHASFPTQIYFGAHAVADNYAGLTALGKRALIITGQGGSARRTGALDDICRAMELLSIKWEVFDQVESNPSTETVRKGAIQAKTLKADFVIGIGGGSPLDAAKAIAILAKNELSNDELFTVQFNEVLPIVAIPTTAGTGSEVTPFSIITNATMEAKQRILSPRIIPQVAFLDPAYTMDLPARITVDTAVDAYSHALESYLCIKTTPFTELLALEGMRILGPELKSLSAKSENLSWKTREALLYGSLLGGMVISETGTTIPHTLGFALTYYKDIPHGRANGMIMPAFMYFNLRKSSNPKVMEAIRVSGFDDLNQFTRLMLELSGNPPSCSEKEKEIFIARTLAAKNIHNNIVSPDREDIINILEFVLKY
jgi:alcohol dehydrogenase class IV